MNQPNRFAPPKSRVADTESSDNGAKINSLKVSEAWREKFRVIEKAGGPRLPKFRSVPYKERKTIGFNGFGFLFGPFYYLAKGMWRKAITYFGGGVAIIVVLSIVMDMLGFKDAERYLGYGMAGAFAVRANIDYYKQMVLDENDWW
jgi:hypothetical protein